MHETEDYVGLVVGRHMSVVVATSHVAACYGETGKTQSVSTAVA